MGSNNSKEDIIIAQTGAGSISFHYISSLITLAVIVLIIVVLYYLRKYLKKTVQKHVNRAIAVNV